MYFIVSLFGLASGRVVAFSTLHTEPHVRVALVAVHTLELGAHERTKEVLFTVRARFHEITVTF